MKIIPAIDLYQGDVVRLTQGDYTVKTTYSLDAKQLINDYQQAGFSRVHVVDLSGAEQGMMLQETMIKQMCDNAMIKLQVGGGIRSAAQLDRLFEAGVDRVVVGSLAVQNTSLVQQWLTEYGADRIVIALDIVMENSIPIVMTQGWQKNSQISVSELLACYPPFTIKNVLCTDIQRDGLLSGPSIALYQELLQTFPDINWIASGGVASINDLSALNRIGMQEVIVGKALYEQRLTLAECQEAERW